MNDRFIEDVYTRFAVHEHLLMELYLQAAGSSANPNAALASLEERLISVLGSVKPPPDGIEDWAIRLLQAQRKEGPGLIQDFFRKVRKNLSAR